MTDQSTNTSKRDTRKSKRSRTDFTQLPNQVMRDRRLTQSDKIVYWALLSHAWNGKDESFPSARRIAEQCGVSARHVSSRTKRLEKFGYIKVNRTFGGVNHYHFPSTLPPEGEKVPPPKTEGEYLQKVNEVPPAGEDDSPQEVRTKHTKGIIPSKTEEDNQSKLNHTKYDSVVKPQTISPNGSDPKEGSEWGSSLFTEDGRLSATLQDTEGVVPSDLSGGNNGLRQTGHSGRVESVPSRPVPSWLENGLDTLLNPKDPIRMRAIHHFTEKYTAMRVASMSPIEKKEVLKSFVEMEVLGEEQQRKNRLLQSASINNHQQS